MIIDMTQTETERQLEICLRRGWKLASPETVGAFPILSDIIVIIPKRQCPKISGTDIEQYIYRSDFHF